MGTLGRGFFFFSYLRKLQGRDFMRQKINYNSLLTDFSTAWCIIAFWNPCFPSKIKWKQFILSTERKNQTNKKAKGR
jgi:hypothetical protein